MRPKPILADLAKWVRDNGKPVEPSLWRLVLPGEPDPVAVPAVNGNFRRAVPPLFDLKPGPGKVNGLPNRLSGFFFIPSSWDPPGKVLNRFNDGLKAYINFRH